MDMTWSGNISPFPSPLSERLDYKEGISNNQTPRDLKAIIIFFWTNKRGKKKSMIKRRRILSWRRRVELSWTRRVAGRDAESGWFLALGKSLDPPLPLCHCHTRAQRHLESTQSLHGAHTSLLKSKKDGDETGEGLQNRFFGWGLLRK